MIRGERSARSRVAVVTPGLDLGGGVPTAARWLSKHLEATGKYSVDIHDVATSSRDTHSRRLLLPSSWTRRSLRSEVARSEYRVTKWGANAAEIEAMRYRPRSELTKALADYDLLQVIAGSPACGGIVTDAKVPTVIQFATTAALERRWRLHDDRRLISAWRRKMTTLVGGIERRALAAADAVLVMNSTMLEFVQSLGHPWVIKAPPGIDTELFSPGREWQGKGYLLSVCRLNDPRKGLERMIAAYAHMVLHDTEAPPLLLAGQGGCGPEVLRLIRALGLSERVMVQANVAASDLVDLYRGASIFLQTSFEEGFGISAVEAMACGLPVVATETAGTRDTVLDGVTGWLVAQHDGATFARCFGERVMQGLRAGGAEMGANGRLRAVQEYSSAVAVRRITDVYSQLLRGTRS